MPLTNVISTSGLFKRSGGTQQQKSSFNRVALKNDDEIFFAHGTTIRYLRGSRASSYLVLDVSDINFDIQGIQLNSSGTLLTAYDEENIVVISLTFNHTSSSEVIKTKSFKIGPSVYGEALQVIQVLWNKTARYDSSLVVLSSDGALRTFNIRFSPDQTENLIYLNKPNSKRIGLSQNIIDNPVSMCFGNSEALSGALTLYILNRDGDVFAIYPFVPSELAISRSSVEDFLNETLILFNNNTNKEDDSLDEQLRFATHLWSQVSTSQREIRGSEELCVLKTDVSNYQIQGPYSIRPYPSTLYNDYGVDISSLTFGDLNLLLISYESNGFVAVLPDQDLRMNLSSKDEDKDPLNSKSHFPIFSLAQHVSFGTSLATKLGPQLNGVSSIAQVGNSIIKLDFSSLIEEFAKAIRNDTSGEWLSEIQIEVETLMRLQEHETLESVMGIFDYDNQSTLLVTNLNTKFISNQESAKPGLDDQNVTSQLSKPNLEDTFLQGPYIETQNLLKPVQNVDIFSAAADGSKISANDHFLRELNGVSSQTLEYIVAYHKLAISLSNRLVNQKMELARQVKKTNESSQRLVKLKDNIHLNTNSTSLIHERQEKLDARFEKLRERLRSANDLPLSSKERQWFKEVKSLTLFFNKGVRQNRELKEQLLFIKNTLKSVSSVTNGDLYTDDNDWEKLNIVIQEGYLLLKSTTDQLKENSAQFSSNLNESYFK